MQRSRLLLLWLSSEEEIIDCQEMNTIEPKLLKELLNADYESLMGFRVRRILMICSNYDAFILEEDGQIETQIYKEYIDLNLSTPPYNKCMASAISADSHW